MEKHHLWVLGTLLLVLIALAFLGFFRSQEGFQVGPSAAPNPAINLSAANPASSLIRCPPGYKFFNGPSGTSMCCGGTVNPYTHTCEGVETTKDGICAFSANVSDPRIKYEGEKLSDCASLIAKTVTMSSACAPSLPYYAKIDGENEKCCKNPVQIYGETGFSCSDEDSKSTENYCIVKGKPAINPTDGKQEKMCDETKVIDTAVCPKDVLGKKVFQNVTYSMGEREAKRYDIADLVGVTIPTCYRINEVCIPETAISYAQNRGAFTEYDPKTWEYSCSVWSRKNKGEVVPGEVKGYLTGSMTKAGGA